MLRLEFFSFLAFVSLMEAQLRKNEFFQNQNFQTFNNAAPKYFELLSKYKNPEFYEYMAAGLPSLPNVTTECVQDLAMVLAVLLNQTNNLYPGFDKIFAQMEDASAQKQPGLLRGPQVIHGFKQECDVITYTLPNRKRKFTTTYARVFLTLNQDCSQPSLGLDICLPKSCGSKDLMNAVDFAHGMFPNITIPICTVTTFDDINEPMSTGSWILVTFFTIIGSLGILAGIADYFILSPNNSIRKEIGAKAFLAFSIYTNVNDILKAPKVKQGQIGPINCIRVISMFWVMYGHTNEVFLEFTNNFLDFKSLLDYPLTQIVENAYFSVDSFFFIGGVLLSFMWFKAYNSNKKTLTSPISWIMFYVHRIIRLSAPYYIVYLFYAYLFRPIIIDMPSYLIPNPPINKCQKYWWKNFLYMTNLIVVEERCLGHFWYLATDMQMFILTPIILVPLALNPILGFIISGALLFLSTAGNVFTVYLNHYPPTLMVFGPVDPKLKNLDLYNVNIYNAMWIRCQVYIMGILLGWFLQKYKRVKIHPLLNLIAWILSLSMMLTVVFGLFHYFQGNALSIFWRAAYSALSKPAWALGLTWIIISCYYGYGGPINSFMSWNIWVPLGKLSYCAYLVHVPFIVYLYGLEKNQILYSSVWQIFYNYFIPTVISSFILALLLSALIEVPTGKLEVLLLKPKTKIKTKTDGIEISTNNIIDDVDAVIVIKEHL